MIDLLIFRTTFFFLLLLGITVLFMYHRINKPVYGKYFLLLIREDMFEKL